MHGLRALAAIVPDGLIAAAVSEVVLFSPTPVLCKYPLPITFCHTNQSYSPPYVRSLSTSSNGNFRHPEVLDLKYQSTNPSSAGANRIH